MSDQDPIEATGREAEPGEEAAAAAPPAEEEPEAVPVPEPEVEEPPAEAASIEPSALPERAGAVGSALADLPVIPAQSEMTSIAQLAVTLAAAGACPSAIRGKPNDVFLVLLSARDLGVSLTTAMREFHVIEGKVTLSPKVKLALVRQSGLGKIWPAAENGPTGATWHTERHDLPGHVIASTFTWEDAQLAHLVDSRCTPYEHWRSQDRGRNSAECLCKSNWKTYPQRMLSWRALGYLLDDVYPEVGTGLYSPDELGAVTDADGEPIEVRAVESLPGMKGGQRPGGGNGGGSSEPERIDAEAAAALRARVDRAKAHDEAKADLGAWWSEREFPKVEALTPGQARILEAKLAQVESKFGLADGPLAGPTGDEAQEPGEAAGAPEGGEEPAEAQGGAEGSIQGGEEPPAEPDPEPEEDPDPVGDAVAHLIREAMALTGPKIKAAFTVAGLEPPSGAVAQLRQAWAAWQIERASNDEESAIQGFGLDPEQIGEAAVKLAAAISGPAS